MIHPTLEELTRAVRGLVPSPDHVDLCADCLETVDRLREERDVLRLPPLPAATPLRLRDFLRSLLGWR